MNLRERKCNEKIRIAIIENTATGEEDAIIPLEMPKAKSNFARLRVDHAKVVVALIRKYLPNAEIYILPPTVEGMKYIINNNFPIVNMSLSNTETPSYEYKMAEKSFLVTSAGNQGSSGETRSAREEFWCAVGAVDKDLKPKNYSSWGLGFTKTCAITGEKVEGHFTWGTSFASPRVVGLLGQWYCWYFNQVGAYPTTKETNSFIKINSHDIWEDGKDLRTGYGLFRLPHKFEANEIIVEVGNRKARKIKYVEGETPKQTEIDLLSTPYINNEEGRTYVGSRGLFEGHGINVIWDEINRVSKYIK